MRSAGLGAFLQELERYVIAVTLWSKIHLSFIRKQLEEAAPESSRGDERKELLQILELRRNPPVLGRLFEAARRIGKPAFSK